MKFEKAAQAGSLESCDILITVEKGAPNSGVLVKLDSPSKIPFGEEIQKEIEEVINMLNVTDIIVTAIDKGALGYCIKARTETAIKRAFGVNLENG